MALDKRNEKPIIGSIINPTRARPLCLAFLWAVPDKPGVSEGVFPSFSADNPGSAGLLPTAMQSHVPMPVSGLIRYRACMPTHRVTAHLSNARGA